MIDKNSKYRAIENVYNRKYFILSTVFDFVVHLTPTITVFLIFLLEAIDNQTNRFFDPTKVFTIISFVGMTYSPVKSLFTSVINAIDGSSAFKIIQQFLKIEDI